MPREDRREAIGGSGVTDSSRPTPAHRTRCRIADGHRACRLRRRCCSVSLGPPLRLLFRLDPEGPFSGGRRTLGRISKRGDTYIRMLLIHGARAVLFAAQSKSDPDRFRAWALDVQCRRGHNKAATAVANKMARIIWAVWKFGKPFESSS